MKGSSLRVSPMSLRSLSGNSSSARHVSTAIIARLSERASAASHPKRGLESHVEARMVGRKIASVMAQAALF
jgi:hypothetical protein